jgi:hypothetical protein
LKITKKPVQKGHEEEAKEKGRTVSPQFNMYNSRNRDGIITLKSNSIKKAGGMIGFGVGNHYKTIDARPANSSLDSYNNISFQGEDNISSARGALGSLQFN